MGQSVDSRALEHHKATLAQLEERMSGFKPAYDRITQEETEIRRTRETLLQQRQTYQEVASMARGVKPRLEQKRLQLKNLEKDAIDLVAEERLVKEKCGVKRFLLLY